ncbi:hypothetical protein Tco_0482228 [Tanacetum coccineum]
MECLVTRFMVVFLGEFGVNPLRIKVISVKVMKMDDSNSVFILKASIPPKRKLDLSTGIYFLGHGLLHDHAKAFKSVNPSRLEYDLYMNKNAMKLKRTRKIKDLKVKAKLDFAEGGDLVPPSGGEIDLPSGDDLVPPREAI